MGVRCHDRHQPPPLPADLAEGLKRLRWSRCAGWHRSCLVTTKPQLWITKEFLRTLVEPQALHAMSPTSGPCTLPAAELVETLYQGLADNSVGKIMENLLRDLPSPANELDAVQLAYVISSYGTLSHGGWRFQAFTSPAGTFSRFRGRDSRFAPHEDIRPAPKLTKVFPVGLVARRCIERIVCALLRVPLPPPCTRPSTLAYNRAENRAVTRLRSRGTRARRSSRPTAAHVPFLAASELRFKMGLAVHVRRRKLEVSAFAVSVIRLQGEPSPLRPR